MDLFGCGYKVRRRIENQCPFRSRDDGASVRPSVRTLESVEVRREKKPPRTDWFLPSPSVLSRLFYMRLPFNYCIIVCPSARPHDGTLSPAVFAHTLCTLIKQIIHARLNDIRSGVLDDRHLNACLTRDSEHVVYAITILIRRRRRRRDLVIE